VTTGKPGALHLGHGPQRLRSIADASLAFRLVAAFDPPLEIAAFATTGSGRGQAGWRLDSELFRAAPRTGRLLRARLRMRERLRTGGETLIGHGRREFISLLGAAAELPCRRRSNSNCSSTSRPRMRSHWGYRRRCSPRLTRWSS